MILLLKNVVEKIQAEIAHAKYDIYKTIIIAAISQIITDINPEAGKMKGYITARAMMIAEGR